MTSILKQQAYTGVVMMILAVMFFAVLMPKPVAAQVSNTASISEAQRQVLIQTLIQIISELRERIAQMEKTSEPETVKKTNVRISVTDDTVKLSSSNRLAAYFGGVYVDWGDGSSRSQVCNPGQSCTPSDSHTYAKNGTYTIQLIGVGEGTEHLLLTKNVSIEQREEGYISTAVNNLTVTGSFKITSGNINVDWGDGTNSDCTDTLSCTITHTYSTSGTYSIVLSGFGGSTSVDVKVTDPVSTNNCTDGGKTYTEGASLNYLKDTGQDITDAMFVCRDGVWKIEGSFPDSKNTSMHSTNNMMANALGAILSILERLK